MLTTTMPGGMTETERMVLALEAAGFITPVEADEVVAARTRKNGKSPDGKRSGTLIDAADLLRLDIPDPRWAVPGLLPEGVTILAGKPKLGKSWLALAIALSVSMGGKALSSIDVAQGDVLYLAMEDGRRRLQQRLRTMLDGEPMPRGMAMDTIEGRETWRLPAGLVGIAAWVDEHPGARLIVIDTFAKVRPARKAHGDVYQEDTDALAPLSEMATKRGLAVVVIHHMRKLESDDWVDSLTGSLGLAGAADNLMGLFRERGRMDGVLKAVGRDVEDLDLALQWTPERCLWALMGRASDYRMEKTRAAIISALRDLGAAGPQEVHQWIQADGTAAADYDAVKMAMSRMARAGQIRATARGHYVVEGDVAF